MGKKDFDPTSDDAIILMAGLGAGLTAMGIALGAAETVEKYTDTVETVKDAAGNMVDTVIKVPSAAANFLGFGRKGGLF